MATGMSSPLALGGLHASVDGSYVAANGKPFTSISNAESALNGFPSKLSEYCVGLTVLVKESGWNEAKEYWVQPKGTTPETYGLVPKSVNLTTKTELSKGEKYYASANINDRPADIVDETVKALGYKVLNPAMSFAEQVNSANTIYEIKDEFDLNNGSVTIPANCTLKFNGGRLKNGTLVGDYTSVDWYANNPIFDITITISGVWKISFITPEWFGAKGDGVNDDTLILRKCVYTATSINCCIQLRKGAIYVISGELNSFNGSAYDIKGLTIEGFCDKSRWGSSPILEGFKLIGNNFSLFQTAQLNIVSLKNVGIFTSSGNNTTNELSVFDDCTLQRCTINECTINGLEIFLKDTSLYSCTSINNNRINCFNFTKKQDETTMQLIDSVISENYISGVSYDSTNYDNVCFSFDVYNGSNITDNFIDYFRVIYDPGESNYASGNISSSNNQYQVFLYFYNNIDNKASRTLAMSSIGDSFNWNDPSKLNYLENYTKNTYKGLDDEDYNIPPYIGIIGEHSRISFINAILENNLKTDSILFLDNLPNDRKSYFRFKTSRNKESIDVIQVFRKEGYSETDNKPYILNNVCITEWLDLDSSFIETVGSLPTIKYRSDSPSGNYSKYVIGEKVYFNNTIYILAYKKRGTIGLFGWSPLIYLPDDSQPIEYGRSGSTKINVKSTITIVEKGQTSNDFTGTFDVDGTILNKPIVFFNQSYSGNSNYIEFKSSSCPITYKGAPLKLYGQQIAIIVFRSNTKAFCIYASGYTESGTSTQRPDISAIGFNYFDTTLGKPIYYNGTAWVDANGETVGLQVSDTSVLIGAAGNSVTINVYHANALTVSALNPDNTSATWLTVPDTIAVGTNTLTISAAANTASNPRGAKVIISDGTDVVIVNVVQNYSTT